MPKARQAGLDFLSVAYYYTPHANNQISQKSSQKLCAKAGVQFAPQARYALGRKKVKKTYSGQENQRSTRIFPKSSENN